MNHYNKALARQARARRTEVRALRRSGWTVIALARRLNVSRARVYQLLAKKP